MDGGPIAKAVRDALESRRSEMVSLLGRLVEIESPSDDTAGLEECAAMLEEVFRVFGGLESVAAPRGRHLRLHVPGSAATLRHAVALCHYDTVWARGTLQRIPFSVDEDGVARGPGCFDMKAGIVVLYFALNGLRESGFAPNRPLEVVFTSDEEIGSPSSRGLIELTARDAVAAYVLESPLPGGRLKTARKGTGDYRLSIEGRAAHAGVEPHKGINAIHELAYQVLTIQGLNDYTLGTTLNVGVVKGGTRPNVVPERAEAMIDVRVPTLAEADRIDLALRNLEPRLPGSKLGIEGGLNRPPMERLPGTAELFERARRIAAAMGVPDVQEGSTGGGSDGNFTAAMGVPTLDGLGAEGDGAHATHEQVLTESFPRRAALLAGLLAEV